jgi:hypothetical protein
MQKKTNNGAGLAKGSMKSLQVINHANVWLMSSVSEALSLSIIAD